MGCFPACLGQLKLNLTTKKVQHQCLSESKSQHESVKLLPEKVVPQKEEEEIMNPMKLIMAESEDKQQETKMDHPLFFNHSNLKKVADEVVENANVEADKETEEGKDSESGSNQIQESAVKDHPELVLLNEKECSHVQEESCSSLFSLSIDSRRQVYASEMGGEREVSSQMKTRNNTSLENDDKAKENVAMSKGNDPVVIKRRFEKSKAIETSLSTWLVESREISGGSSSPESENNYGERQILGVISSKVESISNRLIDSEA